jgi:hypothetical protein
MEPLLCISSASVRTAADDILPADHSTPVDLGLCENKIDTTTYSLVEPRRRWQYEYRESLLKRVPVCRAKMIMPMKSGEVHNVCNHPCDTHEALQQRQKG